MAILLALLFALSSPPSLSDKASDYKSDIEISLEKAWTNKGHTPGKAPSLSFNIDKKGNVSNIQIHQPSGDPGLDNDALEIVQKLAPFPTPPDRITSIRTIFGDVDFGPYMANMQRKIYKNWSWPKENKTKGITVSFKIDENGKISKLKIDKSSGVKAADKAALKAVKQSAPFATPPEGANLPADVQFSFAFAN